MAVYVDWLIDWGWKLRGRPTPSCHMTADTPAELHAMAARLGMRREWYQDQGTIPHYDLTPPRRAAAVQAGAVELSRAALRATYRRIRAQWDWPRGPR